MIDLLKLSADAAIELDRKLNNKPYQQGTIAKFLDSFFVVPLNGVPEPSIGAHLIDIADVKSALYSADIKVSSIKELADSLDKIRSYLISDTPEDIRALKKFCLTISRHLQADKISEIESRYDYSRFEFPR